MAIVRYTSKLYRAYVTTGNRKCTLPTAAAFFPFVVLPSLASGKNYPTVSTLIRSEMDNFYGTLSALWSVLADAKIHTQFQSEKCNYVPEKKANCQLAQSGNLFITDSIVSALCCLGCFSTQHHLQFIRPHKFSSGLTVLGSTSSLMLSLLRLVSFLGQLMTYPRHYWLHP